MATPYATVEVGPVTSTQDQASRAFLEGDGRPLLLIAERQERGRGRFGHTWWPAPRAMYSSLAMVEPWPAERLSVVPLVVGLAARRAIEEVCGVGVGLKWPNDLMTESGKVGGILVERSEPVIVIGCGVNLWWPAPPEGAAGLLDADPGPDMAVALARAWVDRWLAASATGGEWDRDAYLDACITVDRDVTWEPHGAGTAVGIDRDGGLIVQTVGGETVLHAGEVRLVRPATLPSDRRRPGESDLQ